MPIRVLLVDEDRDVLDVTKAFLAREGDLSVHTETDAQHAVDRVGADDVDAVVTDLSMPKLGGLELAREVRDRYGDVPVFVFTGSDPDTVDDEGVVAGFVQKGAGTEQYGELAAQIREVV